MSRKPLLAAVGAALLTFIAGTTTARAASLPFALKSIGPGVYAAIDGPEDQAGSNAGFIVGETGVVVVDAFFSPAAAKALLAEIRRITPLPIRYVVNTHYHADHTGGDAVFREAGATIIAHRNVRGWVRTENINLLGGAGIKPAYRMLVEGLALPDQGVSGDLTLWLGDRRVEVRSVKGHTGGDLVVAVPDAHVLFCGDMVWRRVSPNVIDGTVADWMASVAGFAAAEPGDCDPVGIAREALGARGNILVKATVRRDQTIEISVADDGPGVAPDKVEQIFEAYFTTKVKGTGLGLAIVKHNVELYGGEVRVDSTLGKGAKFTVVFPTKALPKPFLK